MIMKITIFRDFFSSASEIREGFFSDKSNFFLNPVVSHENDRVWSAGKKKRCRQKSPGSQKGDLCQARQGLWRSKVSK